MDRIKHKIILLVMVCFSWSAIAQQTYKDVDSITYQLYTQKNWEELIDYSELAIENGFDFFYLNLRVGIAYFNLEKYKKSILFLEKANQRNSFDNTTILYLFWSNYYLFKDKETEKWYALLNEADKKEIQYKTPKILKSIYTEGGLKFSNTDSVGNIMYFNLVLTHHLFNRLDLNQGYSYTGQSLNWGDYKQHQYYFNPIFLLSRNLKFNIAMQGAQYNSNLNYLLNKNYVTTTTEATGGFPFPTITVTDSSFLTNYKLNGVFKENDFFIEPRLTKTWKNLSVSPYITYYNAFQKPKYKEIIKDTITVIKTVAGSVVDESVKIIDSVYVGVKQNINQLNFGLSLFYTYKFFTVGGDFKYVLFNNNTYLFASPYLSVAIGERIKLSAHYFKKQNYVISLFNGSQLINTYSPHSRLSVTSRVVINNHFSGFFTYQNEIQTDFFNKQDYKLNSFLIGIKYTL